MPDVHPRFPPGSPAPRHVLVVGGAGYIGSVLTRRLLASGRHVRVLDALLYGADSLVGLLDDPRYELVVGDTRHSATVADALRGIDAVVHLGELVGDPACGLEPDVTRAINFDATRRMAELAREAGVRRFVYPSSCSVYGATDDIVDESSRLNPVSLYAELKVSAEEHLRVLADEEFEPVILRLATVFGHSARPRFDLVVNLLAARAIVDGRIVVHGGAQWRPFIHVGDVASALMLTLDSPRSHVAGRVFNVGSDGSNHTIAEIAALVRDHTPSASLEIEAHDDRRNYRVSFARIRRELGFEATVDVKRGIAEIQHAIQNRHVLDYGAAAHSNVRMLQEARVSYQAVAVGPGAPHQAPTRETVATA